MKHVLKSQQFNKGRLKKLFVETDKIRTLFKSSRGREKLRKSCEGKLMFAVFYEPSTRTRFSFSAAAYHLGMRIVDTENAEAFSSAVKGESLEDSMRVLSEYYPDVIVLRHHETGSAVRAAEIIDHWDYDTSLINAGDGRGQHPTQALLDLYTVKREIGRLNNLNVTIGGDLANGRTVRSLVYLLAKFKKVKFTFISPKNLRMGRDIIKYLEKHKVTFVETENLEEALKNADVVYWTRIQTERGGFNTTLDLTLGCGQMRFMKKKSILIHPLPRVREILPEVDKDKRAAYFRQAGYGLFIRMALLKMLCHRR